MDNNNIITKYGVLTRDTELLMHTSVEMPPDDIRGKVLFIVAGTLVKVFHTILPVVKGSHSNLCTVQVFDYAGHNTSNENLYNCPQSNLRKVSESLWPFVISITDTERRMHLLLSEDQSRFAVYTKPNDLVSVSGELFSKKGIRFDCIVRYIGPVQEIHSVGYFFGLELLHLDCGFSPQSEDIPFAIKYMKCDPSLSIFTTADWISPLPNDVKKKFSALDLISETLDKVRSAISPNNCTNTNSLRRTKSKKKKEPTAQFYDSATDISPIEGKIDFTKKQFSGSADNNNLEIMSLEGEEFKQSVENYEKKNLERQQTSSLDVCNQSTVGILKHRRVNSSCGGSIGKDSASSKPLGIMSLDNRDIIVIDKADIHESIKNESKVIVVDNLRHQEVDLAELLGANWPNTAGDAGIILNKSPKQLTQNFKQLDNFPSTVGGSSSNVSTGSINYSKIERNKSPNPLSHISSTRVQERIQQQRDIQINKKSTETSETLQKVNFATENNKLNCEDDSSALDIDAVQCSPLQEVPNLAFGVGSMVEVCVPQLPMDLYGVIRWVGIPPGAKNVMVGVELEEHYTDKELLTTDGSFNGISLFSCPEGRAVFISPDQCANDRRFLETDSTIGGKPTNIHLQTNSKMFGQVECPSVPGAVPPLKVFNSGELEEICGKFKGIQGHHNSCYLDATLFSMFTFTSVFDSLLFRPPDSEDISNYAEVQKVLREEIVNPLRKNVFVRADRVLKLRHLLDKLSSISGLTSEEKDPEEFLNSLLAQIMRVEPFLKLSSGQDAYFYQLFVEKDERLSFPTVQQLFEQSFHSSDIKLKEVPSCLIIQMPRFGKNYKMYPRILPSQVLDVTDIIEDSPRQCSVCGKLADYECRDCFGSLQGGVGLESTAFCRKCLETVHMHAKRANHSSKKLSVPQDFRIMAEHMAVPRLYMELFAVVCIETSHYVAFVKAGLGPDAPWCFFDSMADRKGEQNGYNIPEMITVPELPQWLSEEGARTVNETSSNDKMLPEHAKRLFCDAYMCMYQSTDVMMYR